jgi:pentatricopeptide repeat protein
MQVDRQDRVTIQDVRKSLEKDLARLAAQEAQEAEERKARLKEARGEYIGKIHFSEHEVEEAHENMKTVERAREGEDMALQALTLRDRRLPRYLYSVVPDALRSVERQINAVEMELEMLRHDREEMREPRMAVRRLLSKGRRYEDIVKTYSWVSKKVPAVEHFEQVMIYLIHYRRLFRLASLVLRALGSSMAPHPDDIGKAYHMLIAERLQPFVDAPRNKKTVEKMEKVAKECVEVLFALLDGRERHMWPIVFPQPAIYLLSQMAPVSMLHSIYQKLSERYSRIREFTAFHFVVRLAQPGEETGVTYWQQGFEILKAMHYRNGFLSTPQAKHAFYKVLYQAIRANDATTTEEILALMLECGLEPGVEVYNMLMTRAAEDKDEAALKNYFYAIRESGHHPTMATHAIAHAFHKHNSNERERIAAMEEGLALDGRLNLFFATDALHAAVLYKKPYEEVYRRYCLFFNARLLERFGIALSGVRVPNARRGDLEPDHVTLAVMLTAYCYSEPKIQKLWELYKLYIHYLTNEQRGNWFTRRLLLASGSYIPHIFMMGLGKRMQGLPYVAAVLEDMLKPNAIIDPNVYSWSIFLNFLTRAGKMEEAETVLNVMRARGLEPNAVTMTTLLNGYVRGEQLESAEHVLTRMDEAGLDPNVHTWTSLLHGYVKAGKNWDAGDVFKRMLDSSVQPDEVTLQAVSGITDRDMFEAGLGGQKVDESGNVVQEGRANEQQGEEMVDDEWFQHEEEDERSGKGVKEKSVDV